ncbi:FAD-dependent oxidoreductase [Shigella flexneri]
MLKGIVDIPVYPLKGYSLTIPIAQEDGAPVSTILDETYKIAITRFDNRIRVGGMAEMLVLTPSCCNRVVKRWKWWFAISIHAAVMSSRRLSGRVSPMTPDGTPVVGRTRFKNLSLMPVTARSAGRWLRVRSGLKQSALSCTPAIPYEDLSVTRSAVDFAITSGPFTWRTG